MAENKELLELIAKEAAKTNLLLKKEMEQQVKIANRITNTLWSIFVTYLVIWIVGAVLATAMSGANSY